MSMRRYVLAAALSALLAAPVVTQAASSSVTPSQSATSRTAATQQTNGLIDINSASARELDKLPGIGPKRAEAIIAHRPYKSKDELAERKVVPESVYSGIKNRIVARQGSMTSGSGSSRPSSGGMSPSK
ncbi:MAG: ComEA family DNA-binding protein [Stellaceae bacterium]